MQMGVNPTLHASRCVACHIPLTLTALHRHPQTYVHGERSSFMAAIRLGGAARFHMRRRASSSTCFCTTNRHARTRPHGCGCRSTYCPVSPVLCSNASSKASRQAPKRDGRSHKHHIPRASGHTRFLEQERKARGIRLTLWTNPLAAEQR
ncbi:hypothetical protein TRVL_06985 [Trypanosoma vivax]|nr:hypothetical protein TRVL_06985 [Trypanosoma vivax]